MGSYLYADRNQCRRRLADLYYQQVGRAGRAVDRAFGVLLGGSEDDDIFEYFVRNALPSEHLVESVLDVLNRSTDGLSVRALTSELNVEEARIRAAIDFLALQTPSPILKVDARWARTAVAFEYPREKASALTERRRAQRGAMIAYADGTHCLMQTLAAALGDAETAPCGHCLACTGTHVVEVGDIEALTAAAEDFMSRQAIRLAPRKQWPGGGLPIFGFTANKRIAAVLQAEEGRSLAYFAGQLASI